MNDYLVRALAFNNTVRIYAANSTNTVAESQRRHNTWPTVSAALGRTLTIGSMMGAMLKGEEVITIRIDGGGPIGGIVVDANAKGEVKGYVNNPFVHKQYNSGKLNVSYAVGKNGYLHVTKDLGMKDMFTGSVPIVSGEIGEDFTYYFTTSEQVPSAVGVGVLVNHDNTVLAAGGYIIQIMPGATDEIISVLEEKLKDIKPASQMIQEGYTPELIIEELVGKNNYQILSKINIGYKCNCSKEKFSGGIISLGKDEIRKIIKEDGKAETVCHFCQEKYHFTKEELEGLINNCK